MRASPPSELIQFAGRLGQELAVLHNALAKNLSREVAMEPAAAPPPAYAEARRSLVRNTRLSERLLAVAGQMDLHPLETDLGGWLSAFIKLQRFNFPANMTISEDIDEECCPIPVDRDGLHHLVYELMSNARDAMPGGGKMTLSVHPRTEGRHRYVCLSVQDTGSGMEPALLSHVMEPLVTTKKTPKHKGWGLAVCEGFARQSGGWLEIESHYGHGTTATLVLPRPDQLFPALRLGQQ